MRSILLGLTITLFLIGCGSSNTTTKKDPVVTANKKPVSPITKEAEKSPPSIPNI